jgi:transposase
MEELPDLSKLSHAQKDALIRELWPLRASVRELAAQVEALRAQVAELESRLAKNSRNSSKPPSSEGLKKPKSLRKPGEHPSGGQPGPVGKTLEKVAPADRTVPHLPPTDCDVCGGTLGPAKLAETRQMFDLPPFAL